MDDSKHKLMNFVLLCTYSVCIVLGFDIILCMLASINTTSNEQFTITHYRITQQLTIQSGSYWC